MRKYGNNPLPLDKILLRRDRIPQHKAKVGEGYTNVKFMTLILQKNVYEAKFRAKCMQAASKTCFMTRAANSRSSTSRLDFVKE